MGAAEEQQIHADRVCLVLEEDLNQVELAVGRTLYQEFVLPALRGQTRAQWPLRLD
jgi:hypothetical protein